MKAIRRQTQVRLNTGSANAVNTSGRRGGDVAALPTSLREGGQEPRDALRIPFGCHSECLSITWLPSGSSHARAPPPAHQTATKSAAQLQQRPPTLPRGQPPLAGSVRFWMMSVRESCHDYEGILKLVPKRFTGEFALLDLICAMGATFETNNKELMRSRQWRNRCGPYAAIILARCPAKRMECVELAPALEPPHGLRQRQQAGRHSRRFSRFGGRGVRGGTSRPDQAHKKSSSPSARSTTMCFCAMAVFKVLAKLAGRPCRRPGRALEQRPDTSSVTAAR